MIRALIAGTLAVVAAFVIAKGSIASAQTNTVVSPTTTMPTNSPAVTTTVAPTPADDLPTGAPQTGFGR